MRSTGFNADQYTSISDVQHKIAKSFIDDFPFSGNEIILDLGCGDAKTTCYFSSKTNNNIIGIDNNECMLTHAEEHIRKTNSNRVSVKFSDMHAVDMGLFDLVTSFFCLHMVASPADVFKSARRSLKSDGRGFVVFPTDDNYYIKATRDLAVKYSINSSLYTSDSTLRDIGSYTNMIESTELKVISSEVHDVFFRFDTSDQFDNWLLVMLRQLSILPNCDDHLDSMKFIHEARLSYGDYLRDSRNINDKNIFIFQVYKIIFTCE